MKHLLSILIFLSLMSVANAYDEDKKVQAYLEKGYNLLRTDIMPNVQGFDDIVYHLTFFKTNEPLQLVSCIFSVSRGEETICYRPSLLILSRH